MAPSVVSTEPICLSIDSHPLFSVFLPVMEATAHAFYTYRTSDCRDTAAAILEAFLSLFCTVMPPSQTIDSSILSSIEYNGETYLAVTLATDEEDAELEVSILKSVEEDDGESTLCAIEDKAELETVYNLIMDQLYEEDEEE